jgi:hypothetical protein
MKRSERIKFLKEEMQARDYEGVATIPSSCIFDLLVDHRYLRILVQQALDNKIDDEWRETAKNLLAD